MPFKCFIDPGHGGSDPGASYGNLKEKDLTLAIAQRVVADLRRHGVEVKTSRDKDKYVSLATRTAEANRWGADCYVSIHINAAADQAAKGFEVWHSIIPTSKGRVLAQHVAKWLAKLTPLLNRGCKSKAGAGGRDYYHVIRETKMPSIIVECAFITNPEDRAYLSKQENLANIAEAITRGILEFAGITYRAQQTAGSAQPASASTTVSAEPYRLKTGVFPDAASLAKGRKALEETFRWKVYEWAEGEYRNGGIWSPKYRLFTGTFPGKQAAEEAAKKVREKFKWTVYVVKA